MNNSSRVYALSSIAIVLGIAFCVHYIPEKPLTQREIVLHQAARNILNNVTIVDRLQITRGPEQIRIVIPEDLTTAQVVGSSWTELLAMLSIFAGVVGAIQWIVVRVLMDPIVRSQTEILKIWVEKTFPTSVEFKVHVRSNEQFEQRIDREMEQLWQVIRKP